MRRILYSKWAPKILAAVAVFITLLAKTTAGQACFMGLHQPRTPKSLMK